VTLREQAGAHRSAASIGCVPSPYRANLAPGTTLGQGLAFLEQTAREELPPMHRSTTRGNLSSIKESSSQLAFTFGLALIIVFLVLAAQFESFVTPSSSS
jgi:multidrug efflux pump